MAAYLKFAAISIIAAALLAAACSDSGGSPEPTPSPSTTPPPQTSARLVYLGGRTGTLRICADAVPARQTAAGLTDSQTTELKVNFDAAVLRGVNLNRDRIVDIPQEYANPTFDIGCPPPRVLELALREGRVVDYRERTEMLSENIAPSHADLNPYRFFLYLVEPAAYAAAFGDEPYAVSSEEFICEGICMSVTEAVYVPTGAPSAHIEGGLSEVLSLMTLEQILQQRADFAAAETPIDTSAWRSYVSPLGFELQYPPDWTLDIVSDSQVRILSPAYKKAIDDAFAAGQGDVGLPPIPGASQFSVIADISPGFDVEQLVGSCGNQALETTFASKAAVLCLGTGTLTDTLSSAGQSYWVEFPPGHTMLVGGSVISEGAPDLAVVEAILSTFTFTSPP